MEVLCSGGARWCCLMVPDLCANVTTCPIRFLSDLLTQRTGSATRVPGAICPGGGAEGCVGDPTY